MKVPEGHFHTRLLIEAVPRHRRILSHVPEEKRDSGVPTMDAQASGGAAPLPKEILSRLSRRESRLKIDDSGRQGHEPSARAVSRTCGPWRGNIDNCLSNRL